MKLYRKALEAVRYKNTTKWIKKKKKKLKYPLELHLSVLTLQTELNLLEIYKSIYEYMYKR